MSNKLLAHEEYAGELEQLRRIDAAARSYVDTNPPRTTDKSWNAFCALSGALYSSRYRTADEAPGIEAAMQTAQTKGSTVWTVTGELKGAESQDLYQRCSEALGRPLSLRDVASLLYSLVGSPQP